MSMTKIDFAEPRNFECMSKQTKRQTISPNLNLNMILMYVFHFHFRKIFWNKVRQVYRPYNTSKVTQQVRKYFSIFVSIKNCYISVESPHISMESKTKHRETQTNTSTYYANVFVTYFHSNRCLDAFLLRVFVQIFSVLPI